MLRLLPIVLLFSSCATSKEDSGTDTGEATASASVDDTDTAGDDSGEPLECHVSYDIEAEYLAGMWDCSLDTLCEHVRYDAGDRILNSREAAECAVQALAERRPGKLTLSRQSSDVTSSRSSTLFILDGEGHVAENAISYQDSVTYYYVNRPYRLKAASHFEACLAADSDEGVAACLYDWRDGDCVELETDCDGGF